MRWHYLLIAILLLTAGCGGSRYVPVSGRVMLGNKPLVNATVIFQPISEEKDPGPSSQGKTDSEGRFSLEVVTGRGSGALVGRHKVMITAYEGDDVVPSSGSDMKFRPLIVPEEYNAKSKLTFDVPAGGSTEANFDLEAPQKK
jgi:hypothetical protein